MDEAAILARFLDLYRADLEGAGVRSLAAYQEHFPGYEELIAREYADLNGPADVAGASTSPLPQWIGPFRVQREIARGGQGDVYLAEDRRLRRSVAVKVLHGTGVFTEGALQRFRREAQVTARLDHPGICPVYEAGTADGRAWIAMKYVPGKSLATHLADSRTGSAATRGADGAGNIPAHEQAPKSGSLPDRDGIARILGLLRQVALALHAAHEQGVVHRDVKPGNIMVTPASEAVLVDFGFAREEESTQSLTRSGDLFGTPAYMSPEQLEKKALRIDRRTDVWSLGVTLYEALTLERPFQAPTREGLHRAILTETPRDPRRVNPAIGRDLRTVLDTALAKDRDRRYQTAAAFADDLGAVLAGQPIAAKPAGPWARLTRWAAREPAKAGLVAMTIVALPVIAALVALRIQDQPRLVAQHLAEQQAARDELILKGYATHEEGDADDALPYFAAAIARDHDAVEAVMGIAMVHVGKRRFEQALATLEAHAAVLRERRAVVYVRNGMLRKLGQYGPELPLPPLRDALDHYLEGQQLIEDAKAGRKELYARAKEAFLHAILLSDAPSLPRYTWAIDAAIRTDDRALIVTLESALRAFWPQSGVAHHWRGMGLSAIGDETGALAAFRESVRWRPDFSRAHHSLGIRLARDGKFDEAIVELRAAIRLEPRFAEALDALGRALERKEQLDAAIEQYELAVAAADADGRAWRHLADALAKKGLRQRAATAYRRAAELSDPADADDQYDLGFRLTEMGLTSEAIAAYQKAIVARPGHAAAHSNLGLLLRDRGQLDAALEAQRKAVALESDDALSLVNLSDALIRKGLCDEAIVYARKASLLDPTNAMAHCNLGYAQKDAGQFQAGLEAMRRGHALAASRPEWPYPSGEWVQELEDLVRKEERMLRVASGAEAAPDHDDVLRLADLAGWTRRWQLAANWYSSAIAADPDLLDEPGGLVFRAAKSLVQAAVADGEARPDADTLVRRRATALDWLRHDLAKRRRDVPAARLRSQLEQWVADRWLAPVRGAALAAMPSDEARAWEAFWGDVAEAMR